MSILWLLNGLRRDFPKPAPNKIRYLLVLDNIPTTRRVSFAALLVAVDDDLPCFSLVAFLHYFPEIRQLILQGLIIIGLSLSKR